MEIMSDLEKFGYTSEERVTGQSLAFDKDLHQYKCESLHLMRKNSRLW